MKCTTYIHTSKALYEQNLERKKLIAPFENLIQYYSRKLYKDYTDVNFYSKQNIVSQLISDAQSKISNILNSQEVPCITDRKSLIAQILKELLNDRGVFQ